MRHQAAFLGETFAALVAHKGLLPGVAAEVNDEQGVTHKPLSALGAGVRLFSVVVLHVFGQVRVAGVTFPAFGAFERTFPRMDSRVLLEHAVSGKGFVAYLANERLLSCVNPLVNDH